MRFKQAGSSNRYDEVQQLNRKSVDVITRRYHQKEGLPPYLLCISENGRHAV
jgi:hypothetical protein